MIFSYLTKTPCIVFSNSNYKVKGVYNRWLKDFDYIKFQKNYDKSIFLNELDELLSCKIDITENPLVMNFETLKDEINEWVVK